MTLRTLTASGVRTDAKHPRHDNELTWTQCGGVLRFAVQKEDCGRAIDDEHNLVADGVAFPFAAPRPVSNEYCAVSVGSQAGQCVGRAFVGAGRRSVSENASVSIASSIETGTGSATSRDYARPR